jgi:predicted dienelactone hydrolase
VVAPQADVVIEPANGHEFGTAGLHEKQKPR